MKRIFKVIFSLFILLNIACIGYAQTINSEEYGVGFTLSDNWIQIQADGRIAFQHKNSDQEVLGIEMFEADWAYLTEQIDESVLKSYCDNFYSDTRLSQSLSDDNNASVNVSTESVISKYEYYNYVLFYRYEKAYTARARGFLDTPFYETVFVTAKNGRLYFISFRRQTTQNNFADVVDMLNSLNFANGEIKIMINNERIYPDSAPLMMDDRTLVPIRAVAEKMGYTVAWNEETQLVTLTSSQGMPILHFMIGNNIALKNFTQEIVLDVPAVVYDGRTYLPLRAVAEAMDATVNWNEAVRAVEIVY